MSSSRCEQSLFTMAVLALALVMAAPATADHQGPFVCPETSPGNFVASDDLAVCEAILGEDAESEMVGFKVDPPASFSNAFVDFQLSPNGRYLSWTVSGGATMLAVVVKGGPNYNLYDYVHGDLAVGSSCGPEITEAPDHDNGLQSPLHKGKVPQISHYNVCYFPPAGDGQGCTPGYWRNHADRWQDVASSADFDATFGVDLFAPDITLGAAIWVSGGGANALARHATAALLNAYGGVPNGDGTTVDYPFSVLEVIQMVQDAVENETIEGTKDIFAAANELGCPLSGTKAVPVVP